MCKENQPAKFPHDKRHLSVLASLDISSSAQGSNAHDLYLSLRDFTDFIRNSMNGLQPPNPFKIWFC